MGNWWEKPCIFHGVRDTIGWESDQKKCPYFGESMSANFPGSLSLMDFAAFSNAMGNWWGNLSISHVICDEVYYRLGIWLGKCIHTMGKVWLPISQALPRFFLHFLVPWEIDGATHAFLKCWRIPQNENLMDKSTYSVEKVWVTNFPGFAHLIVFAEFSHAIGNWLKYPYISYVMKITIGWQSNGKNALILWEKDEYQFLRSSPYDGFCWIFSCYGKLMGKPIHFPCNEEYRRMGI